MKNNYKFSEYSNSSRILIQSIIKGNNTFDKLIKDLKISKPLISDILKRLIEIKLIEKVGKPSKNNKVILKLVKNCKCPYCMKVF